jgi:biotin synthase
MEFKDLDLTGLVTRILSGGEVERREALAVLNCPDDDLPELLAATFKVREASFGRRVKICVLRNAQSGICPEDCRYCSQSRVSRADIPVYRMQSIAELCNGAGLAVESGARRYCMVASMRGPGEREIAHLVDACQQIKARYPRLELCLSIGLLNLAQARRLKDAGVDWINHNLNTSRRFYPQICSTHTWDDRVRTIGTIRAAGLRVCSGGIIGMGESDDDIVDLAYAARRVGADSVPVNFLHPMPGTPLERLSILTPERCLKAACLFRMLNPRSEVRAAGGRELNVGARQGELFNAVNSVFVNGYLTTAGWSYDRTRELIEQAGFEVEPQSNS